MTTYMAEWTLGLTTIQTISGSFPRTSTLQTFRIGPCLEWGQSRGKLFSLKVVNMI